MIEKQNRTKRIVKIVSMGIVGLDILCAVVANLASLVLGGWMIANLPV